MDAFLKFYEQHEYTNAWKRISAGSVSNTAAEWLESCTTARVLWL